VTSVLRRAVAPFAAVTALVVMLTACGSGPSQVNSAVVIDGHTISVDDVQAMVDKIVKEQPAAQSLAQQHKLDLVSREVVTQLITHELLTEVARKDGVRVDPAQLQELRAQNPFGQKIPTDGSVPAEQLVPELVNRARGFDAYANDQLLLDGLARQHLGRDSAQYNIVQIADEAKAKALAEQIAAKPNESAALMRAASETPDQVQLNQDTGPTGNGVFLAAPDNSVFVLPAGSGEQGGSGGFQIVHVLSTKTAASTSPEFDSSQIDPAQLPAIGKFVLRPRAIESKIEISPRFGVWNDANLTVVPKGEAEVAGFVVLPKTEQP